MKPQEELKRVSTIKRPWGTYTSVDLGNHHQVKQITVDPNGVLSKQYHHHRSEHWVIVEGVADVEVGKRKLRLKANNSIYISQGETHRLSNPGQKKLKLIEIQCGDYLGEDDIVRLEDIYGRVEKTSDFIMRQSLSALTERHAS